ncbi:methyltransferase, partial [Penicillium macrosclerotiorum]|uniref:methyltransferase n=1 Tax=Penicillium macrosclerotiorum TaxID=303699 RepID=UPI0025468EDC
NSRQTSADVHLVISLEEASYTTSITSSALNYQMVVDIIRIMKGSIFWCVESQYIIGWPNDEQEQDRLDLVSAHQYREIGSLKD